MVRGLLSAIGPYVAETVFRSELTETYPFPPGTLRFTRTLSIASDFGPVRRASGWRSACVPTHGQGTLPHRLRRMEGGHSQEAEQRTAALAHAKAYTVGELWKLRLAEPEKEGFDNYVYSKQWVSMEPAFGHRRPTP